MTLWPFTYRLLAVIVFVGSGLFLGSATKSSADDAQVATLSDIHKVLQQAAGDSPDDTPAFADQSKFLNQALQMIRTVPHVYHGQLKAATRDIDAALDELGKGDPAHKARELILDADDQIKSIM